MTNGEDALESLANLALRSESPESVAELVQEVRGAGLPDPGPPIVLVLTATIDGRSSFQYRGDPAWAVAVLRAVADQVERDDVI
jgi:hypothetical protein